jgi:hypothetical protein
MHAKHPIERAALTLAAIAAIPSLRKEGSIVTFDIHRLDGGWWYEHRSVCDDSLDQIWVPVPSMPDLEACRLGIEVALEEKRREIRKRLERTTAGDGRIPRDVRRWALLDRFSDRARLAHLEFRSAEDVEDTWWRLEPIFHEYDFDHSDCAAIRNAIDADEIRELGFGTDDELRLWLALILDDGEREDVEEAARPPTPGRAR